MAGFVLVATPSPSLPARGRVFVVARLLHNSTSPLAREDGRGDCPIAPVKQEDSR
jgi:hypothetical protein